MKKLIKSIFYRLGFEIYRKGYAPVAPPTAFTARRSMFDALREIKARHHLKPATVIDVGAAQARWSEQVIQIWEKAHYALIEPIQENEAALQAFTQQHPKASYHLAVAGQEKGSVPFSVSPDLDGSGVYGDQASNIRHVPVEPLDDLVQTPGPYLLKLDTHGYELPIFEGATRILAQTELLIVEVYGFYVSPTAVLFPELCQYLDQKGFRMMDIADIMQRPGDGAFWQADFFFLPKTHPIFENNSYR
ncbi:MAG: FkbM family methyltransferase [Bernardetiaceae bacterium]